MYRLGLKLLARVKPSEIFLKSISKEVTSIQVSYPPRFYSLPLLHEHVLVNTDYYFLSNPCQMFQFRS